MELNSETADKKNHYDSNLYLRFPSRSNASGAIINDTFLDWENYISGNLENCYSLDDRYGGDVAKELLSECKTHVEKHRTGGKSENVLALVHPFFLSLSHMDYVDSGDRGEVDSYTDNLFQLLEAKRSVDKTRVIVYETLHHYAAATSQLLEHGLVDDVIFTEHGSGEPLSWKDLTGLRGSKLFWGGGYNSCCLCASISKTSMFVPKNDMHWIYGAVLNHPMSHLNLKTEEVLNLSSKNRVSMEEAYEKLGLDKKS